MNLPELERSRKNAGSETCRPEEPETAVQVAEVRGAEGPRADERRYPLALRAAIFLAAGAACWAVVLWIFQAVG